MMKLGEKKKKLFFSWKEVQKRCDKILKNFYLLKLNDYSFKN